MHRGAEGIGKIGFEVTVIQYLDRTAERDAPLFVEFGHPGMLAIQRAVNLFRHDAHLVVGYLFDRFDPLDRDHRVTGDVRISQRNPFRAVDIVRRFHQVQDRYREEASVAGVHLFGAGQRVGEIHVTLERGEITAAEHDRISCGSGTDRDRRQIFGFLDQRCAPLVVVDEKRGEMVRTDGLDHGLRARIPGSGAMYRLPATLAIESRCACIDGLYSCRVPHSIGETGIDCRFEPLQSLQHGASRRPCGRGL